MKKYIMTIILTLAIGVGQVFAQFEDFEGDNNSRVSDEGNNSNRIIDHLRFGGTFGLGFGSNSLAINFNPNVGYYFNKYVTAGLIGTFEYYKYSGSYNSYTSSTYGGGVYADFYPLDFLIGHVEAQCINYTDYTVSDDERKWDSAILVGAGYHYQLSERAGINMMILWNLTESQGLRDYTSFANPVMRLSFVF